MKIYDNMITEMCQLSVSYFVILLTLCISGHMWMIYGHWEFHILEYKIDSLHP